MNNLNTLLEKISKAVPVFSRDWTQQSSGKVHFLDLQPDLYTLSDMSVVFEFECYLKNPQQDPVSPHDIMDIRHIQPDDFKKVFYGYFVNGSNEDIIDHLIAQRDDFIYQQIKLFSNSVKQKWLEQYKSQPDKIKEIELMDEWDWRDLARERYSFLNMNSSDSFKFFIEHEYHGSFVEFVEKNHLEPEYGWVNTQRNTFYTKDVHSRTVLSTDMIYAEQAEFIKDQFNTNKVKVLSRYHAERKRKDFWYLEPDGSLTSRHEGLYPVEIVTPWLTGQSAVSIFKGFKRKIFDELTGQTDSTTGCHVNIRFSSSSIDWLKLLFLVSEGNLLASFKRLNSSYAERLLPELKRILFKYQQSEFKEAQQEYLKNIKGPLIALLKDLIRKNLVKKMQAVNFVKFFNDAHGRDQGFVEFRIMGGDYLGSQYQHTLDTVKRFMALMSVCQVSSTAYDLEYRIRLMRLVNQIATKRPESRPFANEQETIEAYIRQHSLSKMVQLLTKWKHHERTRNQLSAGIVIKLFKLYNSHKNIKTVNELTRKIVMIFAYFSQEPFNLDLDFVIEEMVKEDFYSKNTEFDEFASRLLALYDQHK